ncbi:MAG: hypothetical protein QXJ28_02970, partial [Candidatus Pacearchaeota archaeon]
MIKRRNFLYAALLVLIFLLISFNTVDANFVCGRVVSNDPIFSPSWLSVSIYYSENSSYRSICRVSPDGNKFCCDPKQIKEIPWSIGKEVNAEIFSEEYIGGPVKTLISGEGYNLFPDLNVEKIITIHSPNNTIILNNNDLFVNVSLASNFTFLKYILYGQSFFNEEQVCGNCSAVSFYINNLSFGNYTLVLIASNGKRFVNNSLKFSICPKMDFYRRVDCIGCSENFVPSNRRVTIFIGLDAGVNVSGKFADIFPSDWKIINLNNSGGIVETFSESHNIIYWNVEGNNIWRNYTLVSPRVTFTKRYIFHSQFEDFKSEESKIILFRFYRILSLPVSLINKRMEKLGILSFNEISPDFPAVLFLKDVELEQISLFPLTTQK